VLRSFDQFGGWLLLLCGAIWPFIPLVSGSIVLEHAAERLWSGKLYSDVDLGIFIVRGESVIVIGELVRRSLDRFASRTHHLVSG
jgi:hypothetical protein